MIDREKVINGLQIERECVSRDCDRNCGKCDLVQNRDWLLSVYDEAIELLKEQETGHWIDTTKVIGFPRVQCSVCGSGQGAIWMNHCPNCGAKMEGR